MFPQFKEASKKAAVVRPSRTAEHGSYTKMWTRAELPNMIAMQRCGPV